MTLVLLFFTVSFLALYGYAQAYGEAAAKELSLASFSIPTYLLVFGLAIWGGLVSYIIELRRSKGKQFSLAVFIANMVISTFVGLLTYWTTDWIGIKGDITYGLAGLAGAMGSRGLEVLEKFFANRLGVAAPSQEVLNDQSNPPQN